MDKTIWTPRFYGSCDFGVYLDRDFARDMIRSKIPNERQGRMNELANEELKRLGTNWSNPYTFYEDSCFISQFYIGQNGVCLSTNHQTIGDLLNGREFSKPIEYNSHNVDVPKQVYVLMLLFDKWIEYADTLKNE
jgi:hypothetical protein